MLSIIFLAIIQALTEFIPVSSSGHLIAAQELFNIDSSLSVDVALHFGTLLALVVYFRGRLLAMLKDIRGNSGLIVNLALTSIPAAIIGFVFADTFENDTRSLGVVIVMLTVVGILMIWSDKLLPTRGGVKKLEKITPRQATLTGVAQAIALIPGTSRSGITMLGARASGLSNQLAAEYAFLAGIPVIAGATLKVTLDDSTNQALREQTGEVLVGVAVAGVVGLFVLRQLIKYIAKHGLRVFGWYRLALAATLFIIWM